MSVSFLPKPKNPQVTSAAWAGVYKPLWLAAALLNSGYSYFWDLERDWEIQAFTGAPSGARHQMNSCVHLQTALASYRSGCAQVAVAIRLDGQPCEVRQQSGCLSRLPWDCSRPRANPGYCLKAVHGRVLGTVV